MSDISRIISIALNDELTPDQKESQAWHNFAVNDLGRDVDFKSYIFYHYLTRDVVKNLEPHEGVLIELCDAETLRYNNNFTTIEDVNAANIKRRPGTGMTEDQFIEHTENIKEIIKSDKPFVFIDVPIFLLSENELTPPSDVDILTGIALTAIGTNALAFDKARKMNASRRAFLKGVIAGGSAIASNTVLAKFGTPGYIKTKNHLIDFAERKMNTNELDNDKIFLSTTEAIVYFRNIAMVLNSAIAINELNINSYSIVAGGGHVNMMEDMQKGLAYLEDKIESYAGRFVEHTIPFLLAKIKNISEASKVLADISIIFGEPKYINAEPANTRIARSPKQILFDNLLNQLEREDILPVEKEVIARILGHRLLEDYRVEQSIDLNAAIIKGVNLDADYVNPFYFKSTSLLEEDILLSNHLRGKEFEIWSQYDLVGMREDKGRYNLILRDGSNNLFVIERDRWLINFDSQPEPIQDPHE